MKKSSYINLSYLPQFAPQQHQRETQVMDNSRKHLAQQMEAQFFLTSPESKKAADQLPMDSSMKQLIQLLKSSPEIADPLLQMSHILKGNK